MNKEKAANAITKYIGASSLGLATFLGADPDRLDNTGGLVAMVHDNGVAAAVVAFILGMFLRSPQQVRTAQKVLKDSAKALDSDQLEYRFQARQGDLDETH